MKKIKLDLIKVEEILTREQLKHVVGGSGSFGQSCVDDMDCWTATGGRAYCYQGSCIPYMGEGSSSDGCSDRPMTEQCHGSTFGCCPGTTSTCKPSSVGGYICL